MQMNNANTAFEILQEAIPYEGGWIVRVRVGFLGMWREGLGLAPSLEEARRKAVREVRTLWSYSLPEEELQVLGHLLESLERATEEQGTPESEKWQGQGEKSKNSSSGYEILLKALEALKRKRGLEAVKVLYAELGLEEDYPDIPKDPQKARALYGLVRRHLQE